MLCWMYQQKWWVSLVDPKQMQQSKGLYQGLDRGTYEPTHSGVVMGNAYVRCEEDQCIMHVKAIASCALQIDSGMIIPKAIQGVKEVILEVQKKKILARKSTFKQAVYVDLLTEGPCAYYFFSLLVEILDFCATPRTSQNDMFLLLKLPIFFFKIYIIF